MERAATRAAEFRGWAGTRLDTSRIEKPIQTVMMGVVKEPPNRAQVIASGLAMGDLVGRTGVPEGTLRMWERRHGFPVPERLPSGHRRYRESDVELVLRVVRLRETGLSLAAGASATTTSSGDPSSPAFAGGDRATGRFGCASSPCSR